MKYSILADTYEKLEKISAKLEKTHIISKLLKETPKDLLSEVVLLLNGSVFPTWSEEELGVANQLIIRSVSKAYGINSNLVVKSFKKSGDLGLSVEELSKNKKQMTLGKKELEVDKVFENLKLIAKETGEGSQDRKINLIAELLTQATPKESKYIIRTVLGQLRVGVAEGIIRNAIAEAFEVSPKVVEDAWFLNPDYGEIAKIAREKGEKGLKEVKIELGKPVMVLLAEKAPSLKDAIESFDKVVLEYKYDGMRCISGLTKLYIKYKGLSSIKNIKIGDYVLTHTGNYKKVIAKNKRKIEKKERVFRLQTFLGDEFKITEGHEIFANVNGKIEWIPIENVPKKADLIFPIPKIKEQLKPPKNLILETIDCYKKQFKLNKNFFRFLGFWIGDGYTNTFNGTYRVGLIFNEKTEKKLCDFYKNIIKKEFGINKISINRHRGALYLYWTDKPFLQWLSNNFRTAMKRDWRGKSLPPWFWNVTKGNFIEFIKGWIEADGYTDKIGRTSLTTKEKELATFVQLLALKFGIITGIKKLRIKDKDYFKLIFVKSKRNARIVKDKLFVKILKKEELRRFHSIEVDPRQKVYNLQVEDDESYCVPMATLHNCLIHKKGDNFWIFTRRLENITKAFPDVVKLCKASLKAKDCIVDGEALAIDPKTKRPLPFQTLSQRIKRKYDIEKIAKGIPIELNLFDIIYLNGKFLFDFTLEERRKLLAKVVNVIPGKIQLAKQLVTKDIKKAEKFYKESLKAGQEGLIVKNLEAKYHPGRRVAGGWLKVKPVLESLDLAIIGAIWGTGRRAGWLGSYILGCRDSDTGKFLECGMLGTGIKEKKTISSDTTLAELTKLLKPYIESEKGNEVKIKPKIIIEVAYEEIQKSPTYSSQFALRFPRLLRVRFDKGPEEADDLERLKRIFEIQKGRKT